VVQFEDKTVEVEAVSFEDNSRKNIRTVVCREFPLTIFVNGREMVTTLCSPSDLEDLVVGLLVSENLVGSANEIVRIDMDLPEQIARVQIKADHMSDNLFKPLIATGGGKSASDAPGAVRPIATPLEISPAQADRLMDEFLTSSAVYARTRGVHSAAWASPDSILVFRDDIGRHNALDKVFGSCLRSGLDAASGLVILSGRVSSEMLLKVARRQVPVLMTKAVPTDLGIQLADELGISLAGRGSRGSLTVYSHAWRIKV